MNSIRDLLLSSAFALALVLPSRAQVPVFDATNYVQNVLTAARALDQVNNQIKSLENQATSLINQAKNLASLPYSSLSQLDQSIGQTRQLLTGAQRIAYDVQSIDQAFTRLYPQSYSASTPSAQLVSDAQERWKNALAGFQDALHVQATVVQNLDSTKTQLDALVSSSQSATGALQAAQAGNQLIALQTKQLADLTALFAAQGRAMALSGAGSAEAQAQARAQLDRFLTSGQSYQPQTVQMFHQ
ncbi:P-type conjugative transfer protein TrbJ [Rhizobiales bacterium GAS113]|nr:P-type conjugative transfer protein TrbJ [Rhizobiales bacterium GAS113]